MSTTENRSAVSPSWPLWIILVLGVLLMLAPFVMVASRGWWKCRGVQVPV